MVENAYHTVNVGGRSTTHLRTLCKRMVCGWDPLSGTPAGGPGVLEDGGSAAGEPTPPAPGPHADPPSPPLRWDRDELARLEDTVLRDFGLLPQTDDGAGAPPAAPGEATSPPAPSSLTAEMQVARCRELLDQWRKDRLGYDLTTVFGKALFNENARCEDELREALGDPE